MRWVLRMNGFEETFRGWQEAMPLADFLPSRNQAILRNVRKDNMKAAEVLARLRLPSITISCNLVSDDVLNSVKVIQMSPKQITAVRYRYPIGARRPLDMQYQLIGQFSIDRTIRKSADLRMEFENWCHSTGRSIYDGMTVWDEKEVIFESSGFNPNHHPFYIYAIPGTSFKEWQNFRKTVGDLFL